MERLARSKEYSEYADMIYPTVIKEAGGQYQFIEATRQVSRNAAEHDVKILGIDVGEPGDAVESEGKIFAIVPTVTRIDTPTATMTEKGYLLGISSDNGATWKFIVADKLDGARTYLLVPDLPGGLKFPKDEPRVVVQKTPPEPRESATPIPPPSRSALQIKATFVANDLLSGAYHAFVAALFPPMVRVLGGPDKAAAFYAGRMKATRAPGPHLASSVDVEEPGEFATRESLTFAVVPMTFKSETATKKFVRHVAYLAISDDGGANWTFIPGITPKMAELALNLPPELKIPEPQPLITTDK